MDIEEYVGFVEISIHAPRAGSDQKGMNYDKVLNISIHAPRAGSDSDCRTPAGLSPCISIHAPRAGSDGSRHAPRGR